jgi:hypothetical protein
MTKPPNAVILSEAKNLLLYPSTVSFYSHAKNLLFFLSKKSKEEIL